VSVINLGRALYEELYDAAGLLDAPKPPGPKCEAFRACIGSIGNRARFAAPCSRDGAVVTLQLAELCDHIAMKEPGVVDEPLPKRIRDRAKEIRDLIRGNVGG
jgi:hypothetical protein